MSDDNRRGRDDTGGQDPTIDFGDEFGLVRFAEQDDSGPALSFGGNETEQLPHWTEPPTGEIPRFMKADREASNDETDVWSAYNEPEQTASTGAKRPAVDLTGGSRKFDPGTPPPVSRPRREGRIVIGTDPTDERRRPAVSRDASTTQPRPRQSASRPEQVTRAYRPGQVRDPRADRTSGTGSLSRPASRGAGAGRDLPTATAVGALLGAAFIGALIWRPAAVMVIVLLAIGLAAFEFFTQATAAGYRPPLVLGVVACVSAPLSAYWIGDAALPLVFAFAFIASAVIFVGGDGIDSAPLPSTAVTMLALVWIGLLGSYAALILRFSTSGEAFANVGTDTLFIIVAGVIANDIAAYFVGTAVGRTPLRDWISPQKSVEGLIGGAIGTFAIVILIGLQSSTWNSFTDWIAIALVICIMAPLGDLTESMFKRNMNIKDFGTVLSGHGGALDRFDSLLFTLPAVYYLALVLQPWN